MAKRPRHRWYWRFLLACVAFLALLPVQVLRPGDYIQYGLWIAAEASGVLQPTPHASMTSVVAGGRTFPLPPTWLSSVVLALTTAFALLPSLWAALLAYDRLTFGARWVDGRTLCGGCGRELRALTRPCCPTCGETL